MKTLEDNPNKASENSAIVNGLYKAFATDDIPAVLGAMDSNIVWNEAEGNAYADGNPYKGPDAVLNGVFARIAAEHEYFNLKDIVLHEMSNDKVLATLRYDAKYKNGNSYDAQVAHFWTLKHGKVVAFQQYADTKKINDALNKQTYPVSDITRMLNHAEPTLKPKIVYSNILASEDLGIKFKTHIPLVAKITGVVKAETTKFLPGPDGSNPPYYRLAEFYFANPEELQKAFGSPEGKATTDNLAKFFSGGVTIITGSVD